MSAITSAAKEAARSALNAAKDFLGIHSPSRRFQEEVGAQIPPGIALGVDENADVVKAAMTELSDYATDSFRADFDITGSVAGVTAVPNFEGVGNHSPMWEEMMLTQQESAWERLDRIIQLLELILDAILSIEIGDEQIAKANMQFQQMMRIIRNGG